VSVGTGAGPIRPGDETNRLRSGFLRLKSALFDPVTSLCSYNLHLDQLETQCAGLRLGVIVVEFPSFGALEQMHGWEVGDRFLIGVAEELKSLQGRAYPASTLIGLEGVYGNAFTLFIREWIGGREVSLADLAGACDALGAHFEGRLAGAAWAPTPPSIDCSIGHALVRPNPAARFERMVHQGVREARGMMLRSADRLRSEREAELRTILSQGLLTTHYQPIVDMDLDTVMGYEALTRGPSNTPFELPKTLFTLSESTRLSAELDALCRQQALRGARGFDPDKKLFLNSLPEALGTPDEIERTLTAVLEEVSLHPHNLVLEITERSAIEDFESFNRGLERLRRTGFLVAIEDVGTGYSTLQAISEVSADFLKIDISLIKNIHHSLIKQDLVH